MARLITRFRDTIRRIPLIGEGLVELKRRAFGQRFSGSARYWEERYSSGGNSGRGSYAEAAEYKARFVNHFVEQDKIESVIEFGCGDGNQLTLAKYPKYVGYDVSSAAVRLCQSRFSGDDTKAFHLMNAYQGEMAQLALSMDVMFHLVEDDVFDAYMTTLFEAAEEWIVIHATNTESQGNEHNPHIRHRCFTDWVQVNAAAWTLEHAEPDPNVKTPDLLPGFYVFHRSGTGTTGLRVNSEQAGNRQGTGPYG